jgi:hypothetical protein
MTHSKNGTLAAVVAAILVLAVSVPAETASLTFLLTAENAAILPAPLSM